MLKVILKPTVTSDTSLHEIWLFLNMSCSLSLSLDTSRPLCLFYAKPHRSYPKRTHEASRENQCPYARVVLNYYNSKIPQEMNEKMMVHAAHGILKPCSCRGWNAKHTGITFISVNGSSHLSISKHPRGKAASCASLIYIPHTSHMSEWCRKTSDDGNIWRGCTWTHSLRVRASLHVAMCPQWWQTSDRRVRVKTCTYPVGQKRSKCVAEKDAM